MTNNHVIDGDYIKEKKEINFTINDDKLSRKIEIGEDRFYYTNKDYDITIIELNPIKDKIYYYLELEEKLLFEGSEHFYENESIYLIQYRKNKKISVAYGILKDLTEK